MWICVVSPPHSCRYEAKDERSFKTFIAMQRLVIALVPLSYINYIMC